MLILCRYLPVSRISDRGEIDFWPTLLEFKILTNFNMWFISLLLCVNSCVSLTVVVRCVLFLGFGPGYRVKQLQGVHLEWGKCSLPWPGLIFSPSSTQTCRGWPTHPVPQLMVMSSLSGPPFQGPSWPRQHLSSDFHQNPISSPVKWPVQTLYLPYYRFPAPMMDEIL